ncbi:hypothetical protein MMC07_004460 [Pseudocyphellaria aurata]|nr:hypothetical protein [Pseudocyphellaria aurata]
MSSNRKCRLVVASNGSPHYWKCRWNLNQLGDNDGHCPWRTLDVFISKSNEDQPDASLWTQDNNQLLTYVFDDEKLPLRSVRAEDICQAERFLLNSLDTDSSDYSNELAIKFLISNTDGYVAKADFFEQRLESKGLKMLGFVLPLQFVKGLSAPEPSSTDVSRLLSIAVGAILLRKAQSETLLELEAELKNRFSFPWLSPSPIPRKRLAMVQDPASLLPARRRWEAAASLGIDLVLVSDRPYLSGEQELFERTFESYVEVDLTADSRLPQRIADALRPSASKLDGIFATRDHRLASVAEAAELLGFFSSPSEAYANAGDKYFTRMKEPDVGNTFLIESVEKLDVIMKSFPKKAYPLVVKPCRGDSSQCVAKVSTEMGLREAVVDALAYAEPGRALIEPYVQGPEVDVNFVLLDGKILFGGVCDNFPSQADTINSSESLYFAETKSLSPSNLPCAEQELLVSHFHQALIRQGFLSGVFHVEGRVRDSSMQYSVDTSGTSDLRLRPKNEVFSNPSTFLHEINARPPGFQCCAALLLCFGVDFWALQMLCAARDWIRFEALAIPFLNGSRDHLLVENLHCPVTEAAVRKTFPCLDTRTNQLHFMGDPVPELRQYDSDLDSQMVQSQVCINVGDIYGSSGWLWMTTFLVVSRKGRKEALEMSDQMVRKYQAAVQAINDAASSSSGLSDAMK